jgi:hypothetical protein
MTADTPTPRKHPAKSGAERQRRYRQRKKLHFLEATEDTYKWLQIIRKQKSWSTEQAVSEALTLLQAELKGAARSAALAETHNRTTEEGARFVASQSVEPLKTPSKPKPSELEEIDGQGNLL